MTAALGPLEHLGPVNGPLVTSASTSVVAVRVPEFDIDEAVRVTVGDQVFRLAGHDQLGVAAQLTEWRHIADLFRSQIDAAIRREARS